MDGLLLGSRLSLVTWHCRMCCCTLHELGCRMPRVQVQPRKCCRAARSRALHVWRSCISRTGASARGMCAGATAAGQDGRKSAGASSASAGASCISARRRLAANSGRLGGARPRGADGARQELRQVGTHDERADGYLELLVRSTADSSTGAHALCPLHCASHSLQRCADLFLYREHSGARQATFHCLLAGHRPVPQRCRHHNQRSTRAVRTLYLYLPA